MTMTAPTPVRNKRTSRFQRISQRVGTRLFGRGKWIAVLALIGMVTLRIWDPVPIELARQKAIDVFQTLAPRPNAEPKVMIADIDERSLEELGQWPWPRSQVGDLVVRLMNAGAVIVGFDTVFAEPDRLAPKRFAESRPDLPADVRAALDTLPDTDASFAEILTATHAVLGQTIATDVAQRGPRPAKPGLAKLGCDPRDYVPTFPTIIGNMPVLEKAALGRGLFSVEPEPDGIIRRIPAIVSVGDDIYPALSIEMLRVAFGSSTILVRCVPPNGVQFVAMQFADRPNIIIPTDLRGRLLPHYARHNPSRFLSTADILGAKYDPDELAKKVEGKLVILGASAAGLRDIRATPLDAAVPGVEVHAQLIESILEDSLLSQPDWAPGLEVVGTVLVGIMMLVGLSGARGTLLLGAGIATALVGGSFYFFESERLLVDGTFPAATGFVIYIIVTYLNYLREERQKKEIQSAFGQYLSPELVEQLAANPEQLQLGGEARNMTIFFSDVRGFSTFSEMFDAHGLTQFMNAYLTPMTDIAQNNRAYIDKYIGDAIMAFWNAPLDDAEHAEHGCRTVLEMRTRMASLQQELNPILAQAAEARSRVIGKPVPVPKLAIGMGVNSGECVVGNMGSTQKTNYSVLGDPVNLAARLEGQSKPYHLDNIIGEATRVLAPQFAGLEVDLIQVKGKTEPVRIYTLVGDEAMALTEEFKALERVHDPLLAAYRRQDWPALTAQLPECRRLAAPLGIVALYDTYEERMIDMQEHSPGADWDGVFIAKTK